MRKLIIPLLAGLALTCCCLSGAEAQQTDGKTQQTEYKEHISKEFTLQKPSGSVLALYNLNGAIDVQGYNGDKVIVEVDERIFAKTAEQLELGKKEVKLLFEQANDSILVYMAEPYDTRPHRNWNGGCCRGDRQVRYDFELSFTVKVPFNMNLDISTINKGDVTVKDVGGSLCVNNVNGPISIKNAKGTTRAHTINGNLTVNYLNTPPGESDYYTLNGTLEVTYPPGLSADLQFKSMNGSFFTDFSNIEVLPARVTKNVAKRESGTTYRLDIDKQVRVGSGGTLFRFETMNGNIYIKNSAKTQI